MQTLIYIHGFRSSAQSQKACALATALRGLRGDWELITPTLAADPETALNQLHQTCARTPVTRLTLIGSSLGGFYAHVLAERFGCRAVLLNPSLAPFDTLAAYLGPQTNLHTGEAFTLLQSQLDYLRGVCPLQPTSPNRYLSIVEMGDTLLDHHFTCARFAGAQQIVVEDGSHDLGSFPNHIDKLLAFAGVVVAAPSL